MDDQRAKIDEIEKKEALRNEENTRDGQSENAKESKDGSLCTSYKLKSQERINDNELFSSLKEENTPLQELKPFDIDDAAYIRPHFGESGADEKGEQHLCKEKAIKPAPQVHGMDNEECDFEVVPNHCNNQ